MKSFKQVISEVAQPEGPDEKRFKDMHKPNTVPHPQGNDDLFTGNIKGKAPAKRKADQRGDDAYDDAYKTRAEETDLAENPMEEKPMMMNALRAMGHNIQGIASYVAKTQDPEEWFQNKLAGVAKEMQTLYSYATAEVMSMGESSEMDRARYDADDQAAPKKKVTLAKAPWEKKKDEELSPKQKKIDHNKNGKIDGHDLAMLRKKKNEEVELDEDKRHAGNVDQMKMVSKNKEADGSHTVTLKSKSGNMLKRRLKNGKVTDVKEEAVIAETTTSATKRPVNITGPDGKTRTVYRKAKADKTDDNGQEKIAVAEAFKAGNMKMKDGKNAKISKEDADILNKMFKGLNSKNRKEMEEIAMKSAKGLAEIITFAKTAV